MDRASSFVFLLSLCLACAGARADHGSEFYQAPEAIPAPADPVARLTELKDWVSEISHLWAPTAAISDTRRHVNAALAALETASPDTPIGPALLEKFPADTVFGAGLQAIVAARAQTDLNALSEAAFNPEGEVHARNAAYYELLRRAGPESPDRELLQFLSAQLALDPIQTLKLVASLREKLKAPADAPWLARKVYQHMGTLSTAARQALDQAVAARLSTNPNASELPILRLFAMGTQAYLEGTSQVGSPANPTEEEAFPGAFRTAFREYGGQWDEKAVNFWQSVDALIDVSEPNGKKTLALKEGSEAAHRELLAQWESRYGGAELARFAASLRKSSDANNQLMAAKLDFLLARREQDKLFLPLVDRTPPNPALPAEEVTPLVGVELSPSPQAEVAGILSVMNGMESGVLPHSGLSFSQTHVYDLRAEAPWRGTPTHGRLVYPLGPTQATNPIPLRPSSEPAPMENEPDPETESAWNQIKQSVSRWLVAAETAPVTHPVSAPVAPPTPVRPVEPQIPFLEADPRLASTGTLIPRFVQDRLQGEIVLTGSEPAPRRGGQETLPPGRVVLVPTADQRRLHFYVTDFSSRRHGPLKAGQTLDATFLGLSGLNLELRTNGSFRAVTAPRRPASR